MTFGKIGLAAIALSAFVGLSGAAAQAAPFSRSPVFIPGTELVQVQHRPHDRRFGPPRRVCRWETEIKRIRGRIVKERVQRCRVVHR